MKSLNLFVVFIGAFVRDLGDVVMGNTIYHEAQRQKLEMNYLWAR